MNRDRSRMTAHLPVHRIRSERLINTPAERVWEALTDCGPVGFRERWRVLPLRRAGLSVPRSGYLTWQRPRAAVRMSAAEAVAGAPLQ
jgi:hypothetical protein